jgi:hypothetical protein
VELGAENKKKVMWAAGLGVVAVLVVAYELIPSLNTTSASAPVAASQPAAVNTPARPAARRGSSSAASAAGKKAHAPQSLDPTLNLQELAATEQLKYEGSGRNIFVSQAEPPPTPVAPANTDVAQTKGYTLPPVPPSPPIPLKFFGFASQPGEPKKIFLSQGEDVFIAGEGEIVNRRYKVVRISNASVEIQDMVNSGPPQSIPLTQG